MSDTAPARPLDTVGERSTRQKRAVAAALAAAAGFCSAQDLHASLRSGGQRVGLTTVYNQLRALAATGDVDTLRAEDGETLYRRCATPDHHHHLVCRVCGAALEIDSRHIEDWATKLAATEGFTEVTHTLEIIGTCARCHA